MTKTPKGIALIYVRVSSTKQDPRSQIVRCKEYCEQQGYLVEAVFQDRYTGGGDFRERPAMKEMLSYVRKKTNYYKSYTVVFDDLKRFARDTKFHIDLRTTFNAYGLQPKCLNYNFDDTPEGRFMETIHAAQNELERHQNRRQVIQKQRARLIAGYNAFPAPLGYKKVKDSLHGTIDIPNEYATYIKKALERYANGEYNRRIDIVRYLQKKGLFGKQAAKKYLETLTNICRNVFYAGYIAYKPWDVEQTKGHHEAIISLRTYQRIQDRLDGVATTRTPKRTLHPDYPLRGRINCYYCKKPLTGAKSKGNGGIYKKYYCSNPSCDLRDMRQKKSVCTQTLHSQFKALVSSFQPSEELYLLTLSLLTEEWNKETSNQQEYLQKQQKEKEKITQEIDRLITIVTDPSLSESLRTRFQEHIEKLDAQSQGIAQLLSTTIEIDQTFRTTVVECLETLKNPYKLWESASLEDKQQVFYFLFDANLEYEPIQGFRTIEKSVIIRLFEQFEGARSLDVHIDPKISNQLKHYFLSWKQQIKAIS